MVKQKLYIIVACSCGQHVLRRTLYHTLRNWNVRYVRQRDKKYPSNIYTLKNEVSLSIMQSNFLTYQVAKRSPSTAALAQTRRTFFLTCSLSTFCWRFHQRSFFVAPLLEQPSKLEVNKLLPASKTLRATSIFSRKRFGYFVFHLARARLITSFSLSFSLSLSLWIEEGGDESDPISLPTAQEPSCRSRLTERLNFSTAKTKINDSGTTTVHLTGRAIRKVLPFPENKNKKNFMIPRPRTSRRRTGKQWPDIFISSSSDGQAVFAGRFVHLRPANAAKQLPRSAPACCSYFFFLFLSRVFSRYLRLLPPSLVSTRLCCSSVLGKAFREWF